MFFVFLRIGLFAIGGAYSFLPLIEREIVQRYSWLTKEEFLDVLGIAKMLPGAISIKYATYTGYKLAGLPGVILANLGNLFAPVILIIFVSVIYTRYKNLPRLQAAFQMVQLAVFTMLIAVAFQLVNINQLLHPRSIFIIIVSFILFIYTQTHPALIILTAALLGLLFSN